MRGDGWVLKGRVRERERGYFERREGRRKAICGSDSCLVVRSRGSKSITSLHQAILLRLLYTSASSEKEGGREKLWKTADVVPPTCRAVTFSRAIASERGSSPLLTRFPLSP